MPFPNQFKTQYRCYSVSMLSGTYREDVERGGKSESGTLNEWMTSQWGQKCTSAWKKLEKKTEKKNLHECSNSKAAVIQFNTFYVYLALAYYMFLNRSVYNCTVDNHFGKLYLFLVIFVSQTIKVRQCVCLLNWTPIVLTYILFL